MATYTSNYAWTKPAGSDQVNIEVLNNNLDSQDSIVHNAYMQLADVFSTASTYAVDDVVLYNNNLYKCITAVTVAGAWDSTKWTQVKVSDICGGGGGGGEVKNLDNGMLSHSTDSAYITVNLDVALSAGKEYRITLRDPAYSYIDSTQIVWQTDVDVIFAGNGGGPYKIRLTQTTASLYNYSGTGWRNIYCDIVSDFAVIDYAEASNKPSINGVTLSGNKTAADLGLQATLVPTTFTYTYNEASIAAGSQLTFQATNSLPSGAKVLGVLRVYTNDNAVFAYNFVASSGQLNLKNTSSSAKSVTPIMEVATIT